jgi:hypothetical protein
MNLLHILQDSIATWDRETPATPESIEKLVAETWIELPEAYLALLRYSNGGEGKLAIEPGWFQLWSIEEVVSLNKAYEVKENIPGFFGFGSNGGGELLAFDTRGGKPWKIAMIPFVPMTAEEALIIANDFEGFIKAMGREEQFD